VLKRRWHNIYRVKDKNIVMAKKKAMKGPVNTLINKTDPNEKKHTSQAHDQAEKDIEQDPDLSSEPHREDDLDEGELARLEGED
jgi:hypothetical protein